MNWNYFFIIDERDPKWSRILTYVIYILFFLNIFFFLIWNSIKASIFLIFWYIFPLLIFLFIRPLDFIQNYPRIYYFINVFILSTLEEFYVYNIGGGLSGKAVSLWNTLSIAVPVFIMIGLGILFIHSYKPLLLSEVFLISYGSGLIVEILFSGNSILFIGGGPGIYCMIMSSLHQKNNENIEKSFLEMSLTIFIGLIICFIFGGLIGGIIGDNLYKYTK